MTKHRDAASSLQKHQVEPWWKVHTCACVLERASSSWRTVSEERRAGLSLSSFGSRPVPDEVEEGDREKRQAFWKQACSR